MLFANYWVGGYEGVVKTLGAGSSFGFFVAFLFRNFLNISEGNFTLGGGRDREIERQRDREIER
jgi:hypothetical protein